MQRSIFIVATIFIFTGLSTAEEDFLEVNLPSVKNDFTSFAETLPTTDKYETAEVFTFQTEVDRMMKLIINSLYRNKDIFLRELISNAADALDKIRLLSLTDKKVLETNPDKYIRIMIDKENKILNITDSGIGMTKQDLIKNLGTIAKSGTAEFLSKISDTNISEAKDMIGQFGVGFYSAFLVATKVVVITKHNDDEQYIWESDSKNFKISKDPDGNTLKRGTTIRLHMKEEAVDFLSHDTIKNLVKKYSQFINFPIYLWSSKTIETEENTEKQKVTEDSKKSDEEEDTEVEEVSEEKEKKKVTKTVWYWELLNDSKPIWTLKPSEVTDAEYNEFYKVLTKDTKDPLAKIHFNAEGEVTFKSLLFIPKSQPSDRLNQYGSKNDNIKLYVRRVFISDNFNELMPNYLAFIQGIVDSDDLPLNVSRENLQQHKLIKIIKKKLIRKILDAIKKIPKEDYLTFWQEYSTYIKLGVIEDAQNRARLSKLLMFHTSCTKEHLTSDSQNNLTSLADYVTRMKPNQKYIYYIAGSSLNEVNNSIFTENLRKKNYEVLYLTEAVDEYALSSVPEFDGKKFQNVAKEGFTLDEELSEKKEELNKQFEPLLSYFNNLLKDKVSKVQLSERLTDSSCALVASMFGWTGNMERLAISNAHQKADDPQKSYYLNQKKTFEINPYHPLIKELLYRVEQDKEDESIKEIALTMFQTATLRSGYMLRESASFAENVENLMRKALGIPIDKTPEGSETTDINESEKESDIHIDVEDKDLNENHDEL